MNAEGVRTLVERGEGLNVEFKDRLTEKSAVGVLSRAVGCMANRLDRRPAHILVGVADDGEVRGVGDGLEKAMPGILAKVAAKTSPRVEATHGTFLVDGRKVVAIGVPAMGEPVALSDGRHLWRRLDSRLRPQCVPMDSGDLDTLREHRRLRDPSAAVVHGAEFSDIDPLELERFRNIVRRLRPEGGRTLVGMPDFEMCRALRVIDANSELRGVRLAGLLLFGREEALRRHVEHCGVALQETDNGAIRRNDVLHLPLFRVLERIEEHVERINVEHQVMEGFVRHPVTELSAPALREGLVNALIHRDYALPGNLQFHVKSHEVVISNPGGFPPGVGYDNFFNAASRPRNQALADAFMRAGIIEQLSNGINLIFTEQVAGGRRPPYFFKTDRDHVDLRLPRGEPDLGFYRLVSSVGRKGLSPYLESLLLLNVLWDEGHVDVGKASLLVQRPRAGTLEILGALEAKGLAAHEGGGRYSLDKGVLAEFRPGFGESDGAGSPVDAGDAERLVLDHVDAKGKITSVEAGRLTGLGRSPLRRLFSELVARGLLRRLGRTKGVHYVRAHGRRGD